MVGEVTELVTPQQIDPADCPWCTLSMLVHANSKIGKTTLAATAPLPLVVLDAEGGWKWIRDSPIMVQMYGRPLVRKDWNPLREPPPQFDGTWDFCVVTVRDWDTVKRTYDWLTQSPHQFVSVIVDSITEIQRRCKANLVGTEQMKMQDWGVLLSYMDSVIRGFRDLTLVQELSVRCVVFIAETREKMGKYRPYMQGQIEVSLPYWVDVCGYMYVRSIIDANGQPNGIVRELLVSPHDPQFEAGERVQGRLGTVVSEPNINSIMKQIYPEEVPQ